MTMPKAPSANKQVSVETYINRILESAMSGRLMEAGRAILLLPKNQAIIATLYVANHLDGEAYDKFAYVLESLCM